MSLNIKDWNLFTFDEIVEVKGGKRLPKGHSFSPTITDYPYIRVVDFKDWTIRRKDLKYLTSEDYELIKRYICLSL